MLNKLQQHIMNAGSAFGRMFPQSILDGIRFKVPSAGWFRVRKTEMHCSVGKIVECNYFWRACKMHKLSLCLLEELHSGVEKSHVNGFHVWTLWFISA